MKRIDGANVAVMISDGFEESEFDSPIADLTRQGARIEILAETPDQLGQGIQGLRGLKLGKLIKPNKPVTHAEPEDYDALLIPGGVLSVDGMRESRAFLGFIRNFMSSGKPVGVICHACWMIADAGVLRGKTVTSANSIQKDLERAGGIWKDRGVIRDGNLITTRHAEDVPAFSQEFIGMIHACLDRKVA
ncbi:MAG: DJ-1/PfpI family protein [Bdellovibrionota bacterium]